MKPRSLVTKGSMMLLGNLRASLLLIAIFAFCTANLAFADMILVGPVNIHGTGFGAVTTVMTMQAVGQAKKSGNENGCSGWNGTAVIIDSTACAPPGTVGDESQFPYDAANAKGPAGFPKNDVPILSSLGITNAEQIGIIFNPDQNGPAHGITLDDLTITLWNNATGALIWSSGDITGGNGPGAEGDDINVFATTDPGVGKSGFLYTLDSTQAAALDGMHLDFTQTRIGLSAAASGANGGPDSFQVAQVVPEPSFFVVSLLGFALMVATIHLRRLRA
jgi:hypothetical protein